MDEISFFSFFFSADKRSEFRHFILLPSFLLLMGSFLNNWWTDYLDGFKP